MRRETMFNVIDLETGWKIDVVPLKRRPFPREELSRRRVVELLGIRVAIATIEDTILAKREWSTLAGGSAQQLEDVRVMLADPSIDREYGEAWVVELGLAEAWAKARAP